MICSIISFLVVISGSFVVSGAFLVSSSFVVVGLFVDLIIIQKVGLRMVVFGKRIDEELTFIES